MSILPETAAVAGGRLTVAGIPLHDLAARYGTPLLVYDEATLRSRARAYGEGLRAYPAAARSVFACKAQSTVAVLRVLVSEGLGMDVASEGELAFAMAAGVAGERVVMHGNNKSDADIQAAIAAEAGLVVVDHAAELDQIETLAAAAGRTQAVLIRVTPGIDADTHPKIATAHAASKFGLAPAAAAAAVRRAGSLAHLHAAGLHVHLGSQIRDVDAYVEVAAWLAEFIDRHDLGHLPTLDLGGGLAIAYTDEDTAPDVRAAVEVTATALAGLLAARGLPLPELVLEPGRSIAGPAGVTLYTVGAIKQHRRRRHLRGGRRGHGRQPAAGDVRRPLPGVRRRPGLRGAHAHLCRRRQALRVGRCADRVRAVAAAAPRRRHRPGCHRGVHRHHVVDLQRPAPAGRRHGQRRPGAHDRRPRDGFRPAGTGTRLKFLAAAADNGRVCVSIPGSGARSS